MFILSIVTVVSPQFEGKPVIQRHRMVNTTLAHELKNGVHALSIQSLTPQQWADNAPAHTTPSCAGGDGSLPTRK